MLNSATKGLLCWIGLVFWSCQPTDETLSVYFTGDLLLDRGVRQQIEKKGPVLLFEKVNPLFKEADFVVANLECPVTKRRSPLNKKYIFRAEPEWLQAVHQAGITHLVLSNNHTNDQGRSGIRDTYVNVMKAGMTGIGFGETQLQACQPTLLKKGEIQVAIFSSVLVPLENWPYLPDSSGACQASSDELAEQIRSLKATSPATFAVVILHWGVEFQTAPLLSQRHQARQLIEAGADAIIGHHPHVVQQESIYVGKPVFYSLGNFVFDQQTKLTQQGRLVRLTFRKDSVQTTIVPIHIKNCVPTPVQ
jgi:poly-gamma-glutamate synthesis protein (capsule biosynthesis protein)